MTFGVATVLVVIVWTTAAVDGGYLWPELTKALISVLTVTVLGGIVKFLLDQHVREREERKLDTDFLRQSIIEAEEIRRSIEHARLLIAAHRSALSYRDQMQNVIAVRVRANELARRVQIHWDSHDAKLPAEIAGRFEHISRYLKDLALEYQKHYKPVSDIQRVDEALVDEQIKRYAGAAAAENGHEIPPPTFAWRAWTSLTDGTRFPRLNEFIDLRDDSAYARTITPQYDEIVDFLTDAFRAALGSRALTSVPLPQRSVDDGGDRTGATEPGIVSADVSSNGRIPAG